MKGNEIRSRFLAYFQERGHRIVESSSLVPADDPTLLFTNAGMVQFKTVFMGEDKRPYTRAVTSQRCVRAGGKHNDLENVGYTARHHTFFEMLGNFSFGEYFKKEAIDFAWTFLTRELGIDSAKLWVSIFEDDDEAEQLWQQIEDLPAGRIVRMGEKDNFWQMGDTGPCGPCSEIHIDQGVEAGCGRADCALGCDCDRFLELWNLVFMQFYRGEDGSQTNLPRPSIDTGMGLERVAAVLQGKFNNYDSDLFAPIIGRLEELSGKRYGDDQSCDVAMRVIADHARATAFLVCDGVLPSNEKRGYVLRRIIRRAVRYGKSLGLNRSFMEQVVLVVVEEMQQAYPHLLASRSLLVKVVNNEEERFRETLENGLVMLDEEIARLRALGESAPVISGRFIFKLYDTFGFPFDIVRDIGLERGMRFDEEGFKTEMENQRLKSRESRRDEGVKLLGEGVKTIAEQGGKTLFTGYDTLEGRSVARALLDASGKRTAELGAGSEGQLFVDATPFYAEAGGQAGDSGEISWDGGRATVSQTLVVGDGIVLHHLVVVEGILAEGQKLYLQVAAPARRGCAVHHTATHLLHAALREVLGDHVKQSGSLVGPDRLRFDFTHFSPVTPEELRRIENRVNQKIRDNIPVRTELLQRDEAIGEGAMALFGEKYAAEVRVVSVAGFSKELCGGTHVAATGDIGVFVIQSEGGIAAGVRRIEASAGVAALQEIQKIYADQRKAAHLLSAPGMAGVSEKVEQLLAALKETEKKVAELSSQLARSDLDAVLATAVDVDGVRVIGAEIPLDSAKTLREVGDTIRDAMGSGVAVLGGTVNSKAALLAIVSKDQTQRIKAGDLVQRVASVVGGSGGGRPDMAQAGGPFADKLKEALEKVPGFVEEILARR